MAPPNMAPRKTLNTLQKKKSSQMRRSICDNDGHLDSICMQSAFGQRSSRRRNKGNKKRKKKKKKKKRMRMRRETGKQCAENRDHKCAIWSVLEVAS